MEKREVIPKSVLLRRKAFNIIFLTLNWVAVAAGLSVLFWILGYLTLKGVQGLSIDLFTKVGGDPNGGGLLHAFVGHAIISTLTVLIGVPVGILIGIYLSEYARYSRFGKLLSDVSDIMLAIPSIVVGVFVYIILVKPLGNFNAVAGAVALAILMIPVILKTTQNMLLLVPDTLREAAIALGAPKWKVILSVVLPAARFGILTGIILGIARIIGETAPLLFTSFNNNFLNFDIFKPMATLTVTIYQYALSPFPEWQKQAFAAALILTVLVLAATLTAKFVIARRHRI
ncbi:MAG TPA: phosphate ABC transporter permease PstA [Aquificales bacterium]|nr:phosphate ABC transporter permease PstA [Aquificales bacterium]